jgi:hypothetical protein
MFNFIVTCHSLGCINADIKIPMESESDNIMFICGPCSNLITDIERLS